MANNEGTRKAKPAYVAWTTLYNFFGKLKGTVIPPTIDKSVMRGMSGASQSQIRIALRWLKLTDDNYSSRDQLEQLVLAHGTDAWQEVLGAIVRDSYSALVGDFDLQKGTGTELATRFREYGLTGATLAKAVRFYLGAMDSAEIKYSPHIAPPSVDRKRSRKKPPNDAGSGGGDVDDEDDDDDEYSGEREVVIREGWVLQPFHLPGRDHAVGVIMPSDLKVREWKMVDAYMALYVSEDE